MTLVVVMGVIGSGKSTVGTVLAERMGVQTSRFTEKELP